MLSYNRQNVDYPTVWDTSKFLVELYLLRTQIQRQLFVLWVGRLFYTVTLSFIFEEANLSKTTNIVKKNCGCSIKISYELPCSCILTMKIKKKLVYSLGWHISSLKKVTRMWRRCWWWVFRDGGVEWL